MLASTSANLGGRDFDRILAEHFSKEFVSKYKIDPRKNARHVSRKLLFLEVSDPLR